MPKFSQLFKTSYNYFLENSFLFYSILILVIGFFTYFFGYQEPQAPFWDENFHIAASQKYINGTFFIELHPPLGKMLIGAGEALWQPNNPDSRVLIDQFKNDIVKETNQDYTNTPEQQELLRKKQSDFRDKITDFNGVDYIDNGGFPKYYSFIGVRFFPALMAFLSCYLFFLLLYIFSKNTHLAFIFSSLYLFNNPVILHFRGAMLDGIQMFFILGALVYFAYLFVEKKGIKYWEYLILGLLVGLAISTKINSLILILIFPFLFFVDNFEKFKQFYLAKWELPNKLKAIKKDEGEFTKDTNLARNYPTEFFKINQQILSNLGNIVLNILTSGVNFVIGIAIIFGLVQYLHLNLTTNILQSKGVYNGYNDLSPNYKKIVDTNSFENPLSVIDSTIGWYKYQDNYSKNVPKLDITKPGENGSFPTNWIVGRKAISYRWDRYPILKENHNTYGFNQVPGDISLDDQSKLPDEDRQKWVVAVKYLYLVANPAIWLVSILGIMFAIVLLFGWMFYGLKVKNYKLLSLIGFFTTLYASYMISVLRVDRVLYLYHYFVALIFALLVAFFVFLYSFENSLNDPKKQKYIYISLWLVFGLIVASFIFYAPFTYYLPLTSTEFDQRNWFSFWGLNKV